MTSSEIANIKKNIKREMVNEIHDLQTSLKIFLWCVSGDAAALNWTEKRIRKLDTFRV